MDHAKFETFKRHRLTSLGVLRKWFLVIQSSTLDLKKAQEAFAAAALHPSLKGHSEEFEERLSPTHALVKSPEFESAVVKIIAKNTEDLTEDEKQAAKCLLKKEWSYLFPNNRKRKKNSDDSDDDDVPQHDPMSPTRFLSDLRRDSDHTEAMESLYLTDLSWIHPTTCLVERLFSVCRHVLTYDRRRMLPRIFEAIICLKVNEDFWVYNADHVIHDMLAGRWDDRLGAEYHSDDESDVGDDY